MELADDRVRIERPRIHFVRAFAREQVVMALAAEEYVMVGGDAVAVVAVEPVVSSKAKKRVAAAAAVETVAGIRAGKNVVAGAAVEHADPVVAPRSESGNVHGVRPLRKTKRVVASETGR